jgi:hypothetical protein
METPRGKVGAGKLQVQITENAVFSPRRREGCAEGGFKNSNFVNRALTAPFFDINRLQMFKLEDIGKKNRPPNSSF